MPVTPVVKETCPVKLDRDRQEEEMEKQPVVMFSPTLEVEVARAEMFNPRRVVVPVFDISRAEMEDVA